jgi:hypothetical protein
MVDDFAILFAEDSEVSNQLELLLTQVRADTQMILDEHVTE